MAAQPLSANQMKLLRSIARGRTELGFAGTDFVDFSRIFMLQLIELRGDRIVITTAGEMRLRADTNPGTFRT